AENVHLLAGPVPRFTVGRNRGGRRAVVACSSAYASLISIGSPYGRPMNDTPTGRPKTKPTGSVTLGYPATAAGVELLPRKWSPLTRSIVHAGFPVGATMASRFSVEKTTSRPSVCARRRFFA